MVMIHLLEEERGEKKTKKKKKKKKKRGLVLASRWALGFELPSWAPVLGIRIPSLGLWFSAPGSWF